MRNSKLTVLLNPNVKKRYPHERNTFVDMKILGKKYNIICSVLSSVTVSYSFIKIDRNVQTHEGTDTLKNFRFCIQ